MFSSNTATQSIPYLIVGIEQINLKLISIPNTINLFIKLCSLREYKLVVRSHQNFQVSAFCGLTISNSCVDEPALTIL